MAFFVFVAGKLGINVVKKKVDFPIPGNTSLN